jgi:hypothetical protein
MCCENCPQLQACHDESIKDLEILKELRHGMDHGFSMIAYSAAERLEKRLQARHNRVTGRS